MQNTLWGNLRWKSGTLLYNSLSVVIFLILGIDQLIMERGGRGLQVFFKINKNWVSLLDNISWGNGGLSCDHKPFCGYGCHAIFMHYRMQNIFLGFRIATKVWELNSHKKQYGSDQNIPPLQYQLVCNFTVS